MHLGFRNLPYYESQVWFSVLVSVFLASVSRSCGNTRIPVLNFRTLLFSCSLHRFPDAVRTYIFV